MSKAAIINVPTLVKELHSVVTELERHFPGRRFTLDGHLVGSIGEVVAASRYGITLLTASSKDHDAKTRAGVLVQIKITQGKSVGLRSEPEHLLVLQLQQTGEVVEVFNGPGTTAWHACGPMQKNGQRPISLSKLRKLMTEVPESARLPVVNR